MPETRVEMEWFSMEQTQRHSTCFRKSRVSASPRLPVSASPCPLSPRQFLVGNRRASWQHFRSGEASALLQVRSI